MPETDSLSHEWNRELLTIIIQTKSDDREKRREKIKIC